MMIERATEVNRAFSADYVFLYRDPTALPQATSECCTVGARQGQKHGLVVANQYRWCSASCFEGMASPAMVRSVYGFKTDRLSISDNFAPIVDS